MERAEVSKKILEYVENQVDFGDGLSDAQKEQQKVVEDFGWDSLDKLELIMEIESEFSITITDEEGEKLFATDPTIGEIVDFTMKKISEQPKE